MLTTLEALPVSGPYYVAYSGGLDSHVLLHTLFSIKSELSNEIHALHVNHGLHVAADDWVVHCENTCKNLKIDFTALKIEQPCPQGESREAWARQRRYQLLAAQITDDAVLLTAHHRDDQAETLLLQMTRGAGVKGLAAMPAVKRRGRLWHLRPLLDINRRQLLDYAKQHRLKWIEDDSNSDLAYDRNFFRQEILPTLAQRWPNIATTLSRVAAHQAEAMLLLDELAESDLSACIDNDRQRLNLEKISILSSARQANIIRCWLRQRDQPVPDTRKMQEILNALLPARVDASPLVSWPGVELRRYKNYLYAIAPLAEHDRDNVVNWHLETICQLSEGAISARLAKGVGIKVGVCPERKLQLRYRQGGEKIRLRHKNHRQELKKLFQERGVPPWWRDRIPLLYLDDKLIAVAGLWIDAEACSDGNEISWQIHWSAQKKLMLHEGSADAR